MDVGSDASVETFLEIRKIAAAALAIRGLVTESQIPDDEQPSDVRATEAAEDDPVALARSMQQKRHGGGS